MSSTSFKDLTVWNKSKDLAVQIYSLTNTGQFTKDHSLKDQIRRSAVSIPSNIAEGNDRGSDKEFIRFLYIAKGSAAELITQLIIANEIGYIENEIAKKLCNECESISKSIGALIRVRSENKPKTPKNG